MMKIAIPTNDKETLAARSGRAQWFLIFDIEDKKIINTTEESNNHEHHTHGDDAAQTHTHSHADMVELLKDCDLMITKKVGPHFGAELKGANIKVEICQEDKIEDVLKPYLE